MLVSFQENSIRFLNLSSFLQNLFFKNSSKIHLNIKLIEFKIIN